LLSSPDVVKVLIERSHHAFVLFHWAKSLHHVLILFEVDLLVLGSEIRDNRDDVTEEERVNESSDPDHECHEDSLLIVDGTNVSHCDMRNCVDDKPKGMNIKAPLRNVI
jgi:hypothetical protein